MPTADNPADCAFCRIFHAQLGSHHIWWHRPQWLFQHSTCWPHRSFPAIIDVDLEERVLAHNCRKSDISLTELLTHHSILLKLLRVTAYCQRFIQNLQTPVEHRMIGTLTPVELQGAKHFWVRTVQKYHFPEVAILHSGQEVPAKSSLFKLSPFLDANGLLRVGGRLRHALIHYDEKHPIILPKESALSKLIVSHVHIATLHGGTQLMLSYLRRTYWILSCRLLVKTHIYHCVKCRRFRASASVPIMADLPATRVTPSRPFLYTGLDYAGPINLRTTKSRGFRSYKDYIVVFVCLSTRAVHLDVVSDYSAQTFIAAYKRFTSRRNICATLMSDRGTTFVGADTELRQLFESCSKFKQEIKELLANDGTDWHFIPPASPHFGGLWEAGVKSVEHRLRRVLGNIHSRLKK